jgi:hypothetical protein
MIDINVPNTVSIAIIALAAYAALKFGMKLTGYSVPWL